MYKLAGNIFDIGGMEATSIDDFIDFSRNSPKNHARALDFLCNNHLKYLKPSQADSAHISYLIVYKFRHR